MQLAKGPFRLWSAFCAVAFVVSLFGARLVQLQGIDENEYAAMAVAQGAETVVIEAPRAAIYDRNGVALAQTVTAAKLTADPTYTAANAVAIATMLHRRIGVDYIDTVNLLRKPDTRYVELARHLPPHTAASIVSKLNHARMAGVFQAEDTLRVYPGNDIAANVVGFIGTDGTGLAGLEETLNPLLAGKDGSATFETADGQQLPLADNTVTEPVEGTGVRLTIDQDLQALAQRRLGQAVEEVNGASGVAVVMDVQSGELLALADYPTYDANNYERSPDTTFESRALEDMYEPGSVEKVLTFSALINEGYVDPRTKLTVPPTLKRPASTIHDWDDHPTLQLTAAGVLSRSSNIGTVLSAERMPKEALYEYLRKFGLGSQTGVGGANESPGLLPPPEIWQPINRDTIAFGQGLSVNAVQMTAAVSTIANGGRYVQPSLIESYVDGTGVVTQAEPPEQRQVIKASTARKVSRMMEGVTANHGLASYAMINGYRVAGKTGTAQRVDDSCGCYDGPTTVSFAGFAPADAPRFIVYVAVQDPAHGAGGGSTGGPVFHDIMAAALQKFAVPPTGVRQPKYPTTW